MFLPSLAIPSISVPDLSVPSVALPSISLPAISIPSLTVPSLSVPSLNVPSIAVPSVTIPSIAASAISPPASASSTAAPGVTALFDILGLIGTTLSTIDTELEEIFQPNVDIFDTAVLDRISELVNSLGTTGPLYSAISSALAQAQNFGTTLSPSDSETLIRDFNNDVVQRYSQVLQGLESRRDQIAQASSAALTNGVGGATTIMNRIFNNLNLGLVRQIDLNNQLIRVLDPAFKPQGVEVTSSLQILLKLSIDLYLPRE
ncbi:PPE family protein [Colletotrichum graminicola M1.001]|uniref:PPE family protein n=1 Tax=Colletotrichum graminicola (strain M1.001 / M2 / FGSC 10212) TaxID=645133 RepID=E3QFK6_COLGM|nr:PPE family protein [Colletotrichum graminicola M1.001]EFQ29644.1 PPE family protein [Colletotrichum graminicola M1.001]